MTTPAEVLRSRCGAAGVQISKQQAEDAVALMRNQGWKITCRDIGEARETALIITMHDDGTNSAVLASDQPQKLWAIMWDACA